MHQSLLEFGAKENVDIMILGMASPARVTQSCDLAVKQQMF